MHLRFAQYVLDLQRRELRTEDEVIHVERQVFDLLAFLLQNADRVVSKDEIMDAIWKGQIVSESALTSRIRSARMAIGDDGRAQLFIKTVHGVGYRFIGDIDVEVTDGGENGDGAPAEPHPPADAPSVAGSSGGTPHPEGSPRSEPGVGAPAASIHGGRAARRRLPKPAKPLVGRVRDRDAILERATERRLVTIVGPGGIGKTHLMSHVGVSWLDDFGDGGVFVPLAEVRNEEDVEPAFLDALGVNTTSGETPTEAILDLLEHAEMLVLIDNAEQVRSAVARLAEQILAHCPTTTLIVSSRKRLGIRGEAVHALESLDSDEARALFVEHARAHGVDLDVHHEDVRALCEQLDGVPLALELASARTRLLSVSDVAARLGHHLSDASATDEGEGRHRSVEAALAWSFDALSESDRRLLRDLSVFAGPFDVAAADAIGDAADSTDALLRLADQSLLVPIPTSESSRFRLLEPVRLFAAADGAAVDAAMDRHLSHFLREAETAHDEVNGDDIDVGIGRFHLAWPNLRAAFAHAQRTENAPAMMRLVLAVAEYAELRVRGEVVEWARAARIAAGDDAAGIVDVAGIEMRLALHQGDRARAESLVPHLEAVPRTMPSIIARAWFAWYAGRSQDVDDCLVEMLESARPGSDDAYRLLTIHSFDAIAGAIRGRPAEKSARSIVELGTPSETHRAFTALAEGFLAFWANEIDRAADLLDVAADRFDRLGYVFLGATAATFHVSLLNLLDDPERTLRGVTRTLRYGIRVRRTAMLSFDLAMATRLLIQRGEDALAAQLMAAVSRAPLGFPDTRRMVERHRQKLETRLGDGFEEQVRAGGSLSILEAAKLAVAALEGLSEANP